MPQVKYSTSKMIVLSAALFSSPFSWNTHWPNSALRNKVQSKLFMLSNINTLSTKIQTKVETLKRYFERPDRLPGFPAWLYDSPCHSIRVDHLSFYLLIALIQSHLIMILVIVNCINSISSHQDIGDQIFNLISSWYCWSAIPVCRALVACSTPCSSLLPPHPVVGTKISIVIMIYCDKCPTGPLIRMNDF